MAKAFWAEETERSGSGGRLSYDALGKRRAVWVSFEGGVNVRWGKRGARDELEEGGRSPRASPWNPGATGATAGSQQGQDLTGASPWFSKILLDESWWA